MWIPNYADTFRRPMADTMVADSTIIDFLHMLTDRSVPVCSPRPRPGPCSLTRAANCA